VLNDEAHHCYREKPNTDEDDDLKGDERKEAEKNASSNETVDGFRYHRAKCFSLMEERN
jgi:hypothetical protein